MVQLLTATVRKKIEIQKKKKKKQQILYLHETYPLLTLAVHSHLMQGSPVFIDYTPFLLFGHESDCPWSCVGSFLLKMPKNKVFSWQ